MFGKCGWYDVHEHPFERFLGFQRCLWSRLFVYCGYLSWCAEWFRIYLELNILPSICILFSQYIQEMEISFLLHEYRPNHGLTQCLSNWLEWVDLSQYYLYQRESIRNIFDSDLESSWCDSNLQNLHAQNFQLSELISRSVLKIKLPLRFSLLIVPCHPNLL